MAARICFALSCILLVTLPSYAVAETALTGAAVIASGSAGWQRELRLTACYCAGKQRELLQGSSAAAAAAAAAAAGGFNPTPVRARVCTVPASSSSAELLLCLY